jgi:hypothetical protein
MSDNSQPPQVPPQVPQDDDKKNLKDVQDVQPKYTVKLCGSYVPIWVVVLVVAVLAWAAWRMWNEHQKKVIGLTSSTRVNLDKIVATTSSASAGIPLSTPSTEETRKQLNKLFNSF